ncbi:hypothetical protein BUALT_Bualt06G0121100 [Buddleja alternifolia]|uniref:Uncharacterized protein n=1 Tax=Buddleja alternifolia TaxID=168488 RepID=A0AAV6XFZ3_9LAMI|nr:hypothetical protein BUALT_Bualt06G0121100 [Buddleja alternifolia]
MIAIARIGGQRTMSRMVIERRKGAGANEGEVGVVWTGGWMALVASVGKHERIVMILSLLGLVDQGIENLNKEQALLCITVALLCLQKSPARRPSMKEVVGILCGDLASPQLPVEFSPSPPSRFPYKSKKVR